MEAASSVGKAPAASLRWGLGWMFHGLLAFALVLLLWAYSGPGASLPQAAVAGLGLAGLGLYWLIRVIARMARGPGRLGVWVLAPVLVLSVFGLLVAGVPLQTRWALSRPAFDAFAAQLASDPSAALPKRLGSFQVSGWQAVPGGWIVYEAGGSGFIDDAGFAYLPDGPTRRMGNVAWESPQFRHLGGPWFSWTASW